MSDCENVATEKVFARGNDNLELRWPQIDQLNLWVKRSFFILLRTWVVVLCSLLTAHVVRAVEPVAVEVIKATPVKPDEVRKYGFCPERPMQLFTLQVEPTQAAIPVRVELPWTDRYSTEISTHYPDSAVGGGILVAPPLERWPQEMVVTEPDSREMLHYAQFGQLSPTQRVILNRQALESAYWQRAAESPIYMSVTGQDMYAEWGGQASRVPMPVDGRVNIQFQPTP